MKYLKKFEKYDASLDLNYILDSEVYSDSDAIKLLEKVRYAIENGCIIDDINVNWLDRTPLIMCAITKCHILGTTSKYSHVYKQISKELIDAGANIDLVDHDGRSALIWAASRKHFDVMELLIEEGANWNIRDIYHYEFHEYLTIDESKKIMDKYPDKCELYTTKKIANKFNL